MKREALNQSEQPQLQQLQRLFCQPARGSVRRLRSLASEGFFLADILPQYEIQLHYQVY